MKLFFTFLFLTVGLHTFSQMENEVDQLVIELRNNSKVDGNDMRVFELLTNFYDQVLQSEKGELSQYVIDEIQKITEDPDAKNVYLLTLFLMYQQHISETSALAGKSDSKFQVKLITEIEKEFKSVYGKLPAIIYVYKTEAFESDRKEFETRTTIEDGLREYPDSVPLKVYYYLKTKDENLKKDLVTKHKNHWMVIQFGI